MFDFFKSIFAFLDEPIPVKEPPTPSEVFFDTVAPILILLEDYPNIDINIIKKFNKTINPYYFEIEEYVFSVWTFNKTINFIVDNMKICVSLNKYDNIQIYMMDGFHNLAITSKHCQDEHLMKLLNIFFDNAIEFGSKLKSSLLESEKLNENEKNSLRCLITPELLENRRLEREISILKTYMPPEIKSQYLATKLNQSLASNASIRLNKI